MPDFKATYEEKLQAVLPEFESLSLREEGK